jgi:WD40 repeat protein
MKNVSTKYHKELANYFAITPHFFDGDNQKQPNIRKCTELPFQQTKGELWDEAQDTLCDCEFITAKTKANRTDELISDFNILLEKLPENRKSVIEENHYLNELRTYFIDFQRYANKEIDNLDVIKSIDLNQRDQQSYSYNKINILKSLLKFFVSEKGLINDYRSISSFICQLAYNQNDDTLRNAVFSYRNKLIERGYFFQEILKSYCNEKSNIQLKNRISIKKEDTANDTYMISDFYIDLTFNHIYIASENLIQKWNIQNCYLIEEYQPFGNHIIQFCFTPDCSIGLIITGFDYSKNSQCIFYNFENNESILNSLLNDIIVNTGITTNGHYGFAQSSKGIIIWDIYNKLKIKEIKTNNHLSDIKNSFFFINNYDYMIYEGSNIRIKNIETDELAVEYNISFVHDNIKEIVFTPDNKLCFILTVNFIYKIDLKNKLNTIYIEHPYSLSGIKVTCDGKNVFGLNDNNVYLWDTLQSKSLIAFYSHIEEILEFEISVDGKFIAIKGAGEKYVGVISFDKQDRWIDSEALPFEAAFSKSLSNNEYIAYAKDMHLIISGKNEIIKQFEFPLLISDENFSYDISIDGSKMAYAISDCRALIKDFSRDITYQTTTHESQITSINISSDCKSIATADYGKKIIISDLITGKHKHTLQNFHNHKAITVLFSPSSKFLVSAIENNIYIWNTDNYDLHASIEAHKSWITGLLFSPDEKILLTASDDKEIKAWNFEDLNCINVFKTNGYNLKFCTIIQGNKILVANIIYKNEHSSVIDLYNFVKIPLTTIIRTWKFQGNTNGFWDASYSYYCFHCESKIYDDHQIERILIKGFNISVNGSNLNIIRCEKCNKELILNDCIIN